MKRRRRDGGGGGGGDDGGDDDDDDDVTMNERQPLTKPSSFSIFAQLVHLSIHPSTSLSVCLSDI